MLTDISIVFWRHYRAFSGSLSIQLATFAALAIIGGLAIPIALLTGDISRFASFSNFIVVLFGARSLHLAGGAFVSTPARVPVYRQMDVVHVCCNCAAVCDHADLKACGVVVDWFFVGIVGGILVHGRDVSVHLEFGLVGNRS